MTDDGVVFQPKRRAGGMDWTIAFFEEIHRRGKPPNVTFAKARAAAIVRANRSWAERRLVAGVVYAVPAGFWQGKPVAAEWIRNRGKIPVADYRAIAKDFTALHYDPVACAQLAADAGIKYVVITAKHHAGFVRRRSRHHLDRAHSAGENLLRSAIRSWGRSRLYHPRLEAQTRYIDTPGK